MTFAEIVRKSVVVGAATLAATPALAQPNAFMNAVAFALTGSDAAPVRVVDEAKCVFMVNPKTENGRLVGEVFYLNNVQIDRISIQPWENIVGRWIQVELRGASTIYEYTGAYRIIDSITDVMTREQQETLQGLVRPRRSASFTLKLYTTELDRVVRGRYIYSNGCNGAKSAF